MVVGGGSWKTNDIVDVDGVGVADKLNLLERVLQSGG